MVVDGALTLDEAYRETVSSLRNLGWKDLELDSKIRGINASFEGENDIWELLINFQKKGKIGIISRSKWKVQNNTSDLVQHLVEKINQNFDLSPRGIREMLNLNKPIYEKTSAYGHFGRTPEKNGLFSWEKTDKTSVFFK